MRSTEFGDEFLLGAEQLVGDRHVVHVRVDEPAHAGIERVHIDGAALACRLEIVAKYEMTQTPELTGEITVWEPPGVFEWMWDTDRLRFELSPTDDGTALTFTTWLGEASMEGPTKTAAGYHVCLDHLTQLLDTGDAPSVAETDPSELERRYEEAANTA